MNYFEIFNKVMLELNYRPILIFQNIVKSEHLRILENINRANSELCGAFLWPFLEESMVISLEAGKNVPNEPVRGEIIKILHKKRQLGFCPDYERFLNDTAEPNTYSYFNNSLLLPKSSKRQDFTVYYASSDHAFDKDGNPKTALEAETDMPRIPMPWAEQILVYGACIKTKANAGYPRFGFWQRMYTDAIINLRTRATRTFEDAPCLKIQTK